MKKQAVNPYLPFWETVPDAEPHVFGDRVYVYGSHDSLGGSGYCVGDYVSYSAPVDDLGNWRYEGVIYKKTQDPINGAPYYRDIPEFDGGLLPAGAIHDLYAPDVCQGRDGKYYLYYALDFCNILSVAVADSPAGPFEFLDYVLREDGSRPDIGRYFDPAIYVDEKANYLYYGFSPMFKFPGMEELENPGGLMVRLADDMHTIISEPVRTALGPEASQGTPFEKNPMLEASSLRKIGEKYYFIYSSIYNHNLCYCMADSPEGPFEYKGTIISNGDLELNGNTLPVNYIGNNHGGLEVIGDKVYVFWHRQTHGTEFSRQGCADEVHINADGTIDQVEVTSCGLNGGPLKGKDSYETYIACHITGADRSKVGKVLNPGPYATEELVIPEDVPYITEEACSGADHDLKPYITNLYTGAVCGFKYFDFSGCQQIDMELRGKGQVAILVDGCDGKQVGQAAVDSENWTTVTCQAEIADGCHSLYFKTLDGKVDFAKFTVV